MNEDLIRKYDGYYDKYGNWFPKRLIEQKQGDDYDGY
jgi:hypothetical protein